MTTRIEDSILNDRLKTLGEELKKSSVGKPLNQFTPPYKVMGNWVEDSDDRNVCEALDRKTALDLVKILNSLCAK